MTITTLRGDIQNRLVLVRDAWKVLGSNRIISLATYGGLLFAVVGFISIVVAWSRLPPVVPLWYSKPWGAERLAHPFWLFLLPSSSLCIIAINGYIAAFLTNEYLVFSQIVSLSSLVISLLSTITLMKTIFMVL